MVTSLVPSARPMSSQYGVPPRVSRRDRVRALLVSLVGPSQVWAVALIDVDGGLEGVQIQSLVRSIESGMKADSEEVYRADVVPIGEA